MKTKYLKHFIGLISFIASILTIGDILYKIISGQEYNFFAWLIMLIIVALIIIFFCLLLNIEFSDQVSYIPVMFSVLLPIVIIMGYYAFHKLITETENKFYFKYGYEAIEDTVSRFKYEDEYKLLFKDENKKAIDNFFLILGKSIQNREYYSREQLLAHINEVININQNKLDAVIKTLLTSLINKNKYIDRLVNESLQKIYFGGVLLETLKILIIYFVTIFIFLFWVTICKTDFQKDIMFLATAFGFPSLLFISYGIFRYMLCSNPLDKYFICFILLVVSSPAMASITKDLDDLFY